MAKSPNGKLVDLILKRVSLNIKPIVDIINNRTRYTVERARALVTNITCLRPKIKRSIKLTSKSIA
jgi:hypothetical protein